MLILVAARSKMWVYGHSLVRIAGSNPVRGMDVSVVFYQVEVSVMSRSLIHWIPTECVCY